MQYGIILSVDVPGGVSIAEFNPTVVRKGGGRRWYMTEGDECYDYDYLEGRWRKGKHRKWCALLSQDQFDAFVEEFGLQAEDVETMGALGAPAPDGPTFWLSPAISFRADDEDAIVSAYVTPYPEKGEVGWPTDRDTNTVDMFTGEPEPDVPDWPTVRDHIVAQYS